MSMSKFASSADYWKDRAMKAEELLREAIELERRIVAFLGALTGDPRG